MTACSSLKFSEGLLGDDGFDQLVSPELSVRGHHEENQAWRSLPEVEVDEISSKFTQVLLTLVIFYSTSVLLNKVCRGLTIICPKQLHYDKKHIKWNQQ